jgi:hypothetical protein
MPSTHAYALSGSSLISFDLATPSTGTIIGITGVAAGETLVGIDFRPANGLLYALGVNAGADTGTLYFISTQTGQAQAVGSGFVLPSPFDLPPGNYGFDFNPAVDRIRVTTDTGLNFRLNPNNGALAGLDTSIVGSQISGVAYTNNHPDNGGITTLYTLDALDDQLQIQSNPNAGTQVAVGPTGVNFSVVNGFDIPIGVNAAALNGPVASGSGFALLTVGGTTGLYSINLVSGAATLVGNFLSGITGFAIQNNFGAPPHWAGSVGFNAHPAGWALAGVGDLTGDATSDVVWYNATTGNIDLWKMSNGQWAGSLDVGSHPLGWQLAGIGDLNGDGTSDLLWHNPTTGNVDLWKISNGQWAGSVDVGPHPLGYQVAGIADFNHDGTRDVLWYNPTNGATEIWKIVNGQWSATLNLGSHPLGWVPAGIGDFNHDGTSDVAWYNATTGNVDIWQIVNGQWNASFDLGSHPLGWTPAGIGEFNADGTSDIAWYNSATGNVDIWQVVNAHWAGSVNLGSHPPGSALSAVGDFNHDFMSDILWRDVGTGAIDEWLISNI